MALTATKLRIARSLTPAKVPTNGQLVDGQLALNLADMKLFSNNSAGVVTLLASAATVTLAASAVQEVNGIAAVAGAVTLTPADIGQYGVAPLDVNGKIPTANLPESVIGAVVYMGTYNAATDAPTLPDPTTNKGQYWVVTVGGTQHGLDLTVGDWIISNGTVYEKVDALDGVSSVNGQTGVVVLTAADVGAVAISEGTVAEAIDFTGDLSFAGENTVTGTLVVPTATLGSQAVNLDQVNALIGEGGVVASVNGQTGVVVLTAVNVGALPATNGTVSVATTFSNPVVVPNAALDTQAVNLGQVNALIAAGGAVTSVNGETGDVVLTAADVGALAVTGGNVAGTLTFTGNVTFNNPVTAPVATVDGEVPNLGQVNDLIDAAVGAGGTVKSVALAAPDTFTVAGSPITDTGTLTLAWADVDPNLVLAGPADGSPGAPTFRALEQADLPTDLVLDEGEY